jgi:hypothetical protein
MSTKAPIPIPKKLYSFETGYLYHRCLVCNSDLQNGKEYLIEKMIKVYPGFTAMDTVFDYAMCLNCAQKMQEEISEESRLNLTNLYKKSSFSQIDINEENDIEKCFETCCITNKKINESSEYQLVALCVKGNLHSDFPPYAISFDGIVHINSILSKSTKEFFDRFYDTYFSPDPSLFNDRPRFVLF